MISGSTASLNCIYVCSREYQNPPGPSVITVPPEVIREDPGLLFDVDDELPGDKLLPDEELPGDNAVPDDELPPDEELPGAELPGTPEV